MLAKFTATTAPATVVLIHLARASAKEAAVGILVHDSQCLFQVQRDGVGNVAAPLQVGAHPVKLPEFA